jgi:hypothetical protein
VIEGIFTGQSRALKRPSFRDGNASTSGKIDIRSFDKNKSTQDEVVTEKDVHSSLSLEAKESIKVQTLSWIELIKKKHGV